MTASPSCWACSKELTAGNRFCPFCGAHQDIGSAPIPNVTDRCAAAFLDLAILAGAAILLYEEKWSGWLLVPMWLALTEIGFRLRGSIGKATLGLAVRVH